MAAYSCSYYSVQTARCGTNCGEADDDVISDDTARNAIPLQPTWLGPVTDSSGSTALASPSRYVLGLASETARCGETGNRLCPIVLRVSSGQTIQVSLWELDIASDNTGFDKKQLRLQLKVTDEIDQGQPAGALVQGQPAGALVNYMKQQTSLVTERCHRCVFTLIIISQVYTLKYRSGCTNNDSCFFS